MSDWKPLTPDQIQKALDERVSNPCPMCDGTTWDVPGDRLVVFPSVDTEQGFVNIESPDDEGGFGFRGVRALPVVCRDCGFIASFHYDRLSE